MLDLLQRWYRAGGESRGGGGWVAEMGGRIAGRAHPAKNPRQVSLIQAYIVYILGNSFGVPCCVKMLTFRDEKVGSRPSSTMERTLR
jgi:hypothetical protein